MQGGGQRDFDGSAAQVPPAVEHFAERHRLLGWVSDLFVGGSVATGDYRAGVSDIDLVALVDGTIDPRRRDALVALHRDLDAGEATGTDLGCAYLEPSRVTDANARHPTWTRGMLVDRSLSGIARAELVRHGFSVIGRPPQEVFRPVSDDDVRCASRAELTGYWTLAVRHPWWWLDPVVADLGLTSMARARYALETGQLMTKTAAIDAARVPGWLHADLRARRDGSPVRSPHIRTAWIAWDDARRTIASAREWKPALRG